MKVQPHEVLVTEYEFDSWIKNGVIVKDPISDGYMMSCGPYDEYEVERYCAIKNSGFAPEIKNKVREKNKDKNGEYKSDDLENDSKKGALRLYDYKGDECEVDHIIPKALGGSNSISNAQLVSRDYNQLKKNNTNIKYRKYIKKVVKDNTVSELTGFNPASGKKQKEVFNQLVKRMIKNIDEKDLPPSRGVMRLRGEETGEINPKKQHKGTD